jgi:hypothetical protein
MKKINALLNEVTLINFALVGRLAKRYRGLTVLALAAVFGCVFYFHFSQHTIYSKKVYFKVKKVEENTRSSKIAALVDDVSSSFVNQNEVTAIITNYKFVRRLSEMVVDSPNFKSLDFRNPKVNSLDKHRIFSGDCRDRACHISRLESILPGLYSVESEIGTGRFILTITTIAEKTTSELLKSFILALGENRYNALLLDYNKQIEHTAELMKVNRSHIQRIGGFEKMGALESLQASIDRQNEKIRDIVSRLTSEKQQSHYHEIRLKTTEKTAGLGIETKNKHEYENYVQLAKEIEKIKADINVLKVVPEVARTTTDVQILTKLKSDLLVKEEELNSFGKMTRNVSSEQTFIESQISNQTNYEFDFKISKQRLKRLEVESVVAKEELDDLLSRKALLDDEVLALKPDLEFLKSLEAKMVSLRMLRSGARSDIQFEEFGPEVKTFRRNSLIRITVFSLLFIGFLLFLALIVVYLFDDRIFEEDEITKCMDDLKIIGEAPHFHG